MAKNYYYPRSDGGFSFWAKNLVACLQTSFTRFQIPGEEVERLGTLYGDFAAKLGIAESIDTRTKSAVQAKNDARKILEQALRQDIKEFLTYNRLVTNIDRDNMGLPIHKITRTHAPVATTYPDFDIDSSMIRRLTIHFYDQGKKKSKAKPDGQHGAKIRWAILDSPPTTIEELVNSSFGTRPPFTLEFNGNQRGKTVYFCLCWENTRTERGPWGPIKSAIIP
ncbi:MAG: hypothetical protein LBJ67_05845 [Planctomycetaceae bacterium]|jgi:hypothetical protein|nr:hypothetical protein [Planctomycetaceae bacterium]